MYAEIVFPLPFRNSFTYLIPEEFVLMAKPGVRAVAPFGKRTLTGFILRVIEKLEKEPTQKLKKISDILDDLPVFDDKSVEFYKWISEYYLSSLGEALKNAVPQGTDIETKRKISADSEICKDLLEKEKNKDGIKSKLLKILSEKPEVKMAYLQKETGKKNLYSLLKTMEKKGIVTVIDELDTGSVSVKTQKYVKLVKPKSEIFNFIPEMEKKSPKQVIILLELLSMKEEDIELAKLLQKTNSSQGSVESISAKGLAEIFDKEIERNYSETYIEEKREFDLTLKQKEIIERVSVNVKNKEFKSYLLHGITGSGKTQVYIELAKIALKSGRNVMILVPEIALTPQMTARFMNNFPGLISLIHSKMSKGERYDSWRNIIKEKSRIVIGPRSALFAPLKNIGFIVVDEEHDHSYKQTEMVPKYNARDAAIVKAKFESCPVLLGSATPSVESMYNTYTGKYELLELNERVDNASLPEIKLIDIRVEQKSKTMHTIFSKYLLDQIKDRLAKKEGIILLQNRRGFATQVYCADCGEIETCENCSVSLVHHISRNILHCHYCNFIKAVPKACSNCGSLSLKFFGTGTQKVEDELGFYFPEARVERIDSDSLQKKGELGLIFNSFRKGEIDILVGTQIVSKGLDFGNCTLVGVISAETTLWLPDFRADERTFQLLTQVSGRAGRSSKPGEVVIQTQDHKNFVLQKVLMSDYPGFLEKELQMRKVNGYPPFSRLCIIEAKDLDEENALGAINSFHNYLMKYGKNIILHTPAPAIIYKLRNFFRYQLLIKSDRQVDPSGNYLRSSVLEAYVEFNRESRFSRVKITIDIDPV